MNMGNFFEIFIYIMIGLAVIAFILPDPDKSRTKSAKDAVKTEFPNVLKLLILVFFLVMIVTAIRGF